jgi:probable rRNA maturation factor
MVFNSLVKFKVINLTNYKLKKETIKIKLILKHGLKVLNINSKKFNLILVDDNYIQKLNKKYRNIDKVTDVITFALLDEKKEFVTNNDVLGDIYISVDTAIKQSKDYGHSLIRELSFLSIHGLLHLTGYDHIEKKDEEIMFRKQEEILDENK